MSELLKINVNEHTERKGNLTYLSWAWAWAEVLKIDPAASWVTHEWGDRPAMFLPDGTAMVKVSVTIKGDTKSCVLPVMNHKNQAIANPNAFAVNTAIMRCLAKAIAMHGLGLYIYAGEDVPEGDAVEEKRGITVDPRGDLGKDVDTQRRDDFVAEFRAAFDLDAEEREIAQAVMAVHQRISTDHDLYVAVADAMTPRERSAIKKYIVIAKEKPRADFN